MATQEVSKKVNVVFYSDVKVNSSFGSHFEPMRVAYSRLSRKYALTKNEYKLIERINKMINTIAISKTEMPASERVLLWY